MRRVLITGGSSGIGLACAHALVRDGATVALSARPGPALERAAASLGPRAIAVAADVRSPHEARAAVAEAADRLGGLDALVANAGAAAYGPFMEMDPEDFRLTVETTMLGTLNTVHAALPHLARTRGTVVIVGSVAARVATPWLASYSAAKHGVRGFGRALQAELAALRIPARVAMVHPGPVDTPFWRRARTVDRRRPPKVRGAYRAEDVADEVLRALDSPRTERMVGALMAVWAFADALAPNLSVRATGPIARLGWRRRARQPAQADDALTRHASEPAVDGGLRSRPSVLRRIRDRVGVGR